jgi:hypothetical protein
VEGIVEAPSEGTEINLSFVIEGNLLRLNSVALDGRYGRFLLGTAHPRTLVSPSFAGPRPLPDALLRLNDRQSVRIDDPLVTGLGGAGEAIIGFDAWRGRALTINYVAGLVTWQARGTTGPEVTLFRFSDLPAVEVLVNGEPVRAIVDTTSPDTLVLPRGDRPAGRMEARVALAGIEYSALDVALADISRPRIGNRLLSKFLLSIDYGQQQVGLWRDTRVPLE